MRIAGRQILDTFCRKHPAARGWIENWLEVAEPAAWKTPSDIKQNYASASFLPGGVVIFNVKGNLYRLEAVVVYRIGVIVVVWAGTHAAYDMRNRKRGRRS
jgi:mRNA interferase HigB